MVKVFNNIYFRHLASLARPAGARTAARSPIAGDDAAAKAAVTEFLDAIGYDAVDVGPLAEGWRYQRDTAGVRRSGSTPTGCVPRWRRPCATATCDDADGLRSPPGAGRPRPTRLKRRGAAPLIRLFPRRWRRADVASGAWTFPASSPSARAATASSTRSRRRSWRPSAGPCTCARDCPCSTWPAARASCSAPGPATTGVTGTGVDISTVFIGGGPGPGGRPRRRRPGHVRARRRVRLRRARAGRRRLLRRRDLDRRRRAGHPRAPRTQPASRRDRRSSASRSGGSTRPTRRPSRAASPSPRRIPRPARPDRPFRDVGWDVVEMVLADQDSWDRYVAAQWLNTADLARRATPTTSWPGQMRHELTDRAAASTSRTSVRTSAGASSR